MGLWSKLFGSGVAPVVNAVNDTAKTAADIVERWAPGDTKQAAMLADVQKALTEAQTAARQYDPRTTSTHAFAEFINVLVDAACRLIRPGVTVMLVGGVFGWWPVETKTLDPIVLTWSESVIGFWFGIRAVTRDIPSLVKMLYELRRKA